MPFIKRVSKYNHVFGTNAKKDQCYENIRISKSSWDNTFSDVNPKFLAVITENSGAFLVIPLTKTGRVAADAPLVSGHKSAVLDIAWCPHNDNVIASCSEDCHIKVWQIPEEGLKSTMTECVVDLAGHQRGVRLIKWHPAAQNILLSAGSDDQVIIWNVGTGEALHSFSIPSQIFSASWSWTGTDVVFTCKDKKLRIVNPRKGEVKEECIAHEGMKPSQAVYTKDGKIFTTGFTKQSERQYSLREPGNLDNPLILENLDVTNGVMFPMYDPDANLVYLCGKGDNVIRYFEISDEKPFVHYITTYQGNEGQRGIAMLPKRGCDASICETAKFYRTNAKGFCQVISFTVPRKSEIFQADLYPDTQSGAAAVTAEEWWGGKDSTPALMQVTEEMGKGAGNVGEELVVERVSKPNILNRTSVQRTPTASVDMDKITATLMAEVEKKMGKKVEELEKEVERLKTTVSDYEQRIKTLEESK